MEKYITNDDYLKAKGINLEVELQDDDNKSNKVTRFIHEVTDWLTDYVVRVYACNDINEAFNPNGWDNLPEFRQKFFRMAVIEQIEYILNNGLISVNSGINQNLGIVVDYTAVELSHNAYNKLFLGAFCNIRKGRF